MSVTNIERWRATAQAEPRESFLERAEFVSHFIRPGDVVCDLGAGAQPLRRFLPKSAVYVPVDCVADRPDTHVADFNAEFTLPERDFDIILCIGLLPYLQDLPRFFGYLSQHKAGTFIVFTYELRVLKEKHIRRGYLNAMEKLEDAVSFFSQYIEDLAIILDKGNGRLFFSGRLHNKGAGDNTLIKRRPINQLVNADYKSALSTLGIWKPNKYVSIS